MTQQPLFQEPPTAVPPTQPVEVDAAPVWLQRFSLIVLVLFCIMLGVLVAILPWSPLYWDRNTWLLMHPAAARLAHTGWLRGLISGLGLLDIWIGVSEALHYHDQRP